MKDRAKQVQRSNVSIANGRIRRRNYIFEFKVKCNTRGGLDSDSTNTL